jgi:hypothetical protein
MNAQGDRPGRLVDDVDEGLAAERTELAWGRSLLSLFACGAAIAKGVPHVDGGEGRPVLGVIVLGIATVVWLSGMPLRRIEERSHQPVAARCCWRCCSPRELQTPRGWRASHQMSPTETISGR